jgi:AcrR family transcriptional regulator
MPSAVSSTREQLLHVAIKLFGSRSFESVSVRDITSQAKANIGAINYYFGSKDNLIREVLRTLAVPINERRIQSLSDYLATLNGARPELDVVIRLLLEPFIRAARNKSSNSIYYPRLIVLSRALPEKLIGPYISEQHDAMARQFVKAIGQALPDLNEEEIFWRYEFTIGALVNIVGDGFRSYRLMQLSNGVCDTDDADRIIEQLVAFVAAGMRGETPDNVKPKQKFARKASAGRSGAAG